MRRALPTALLLLALATVPATATAAADRSEALLADACNDEHVDGRYSQSDYIKALKKLAGDSDQYTACRDAIEEARRAATSRGGNDDGSSGSGGSGGGQGTGTPTTGDSGEREGSLGTDPLADATPQERDAVEKATEASKPVDLGDGLVVRPSLASADAAVPTSLVAALIALGAAALGAIGWLVQARVRAHRGS